jgi:hypothetical protein
MTIVGNLDERTRSEVFLRGYKKGRLKRSKAEEVK